MTMICCHLKQCVNVWDVFIWRAYWLLWTEWRLTLHGLFRTMHELSSVSEHGIYLRYSGTGCIIRACHGWSRCNSFCLVFVPDTVQCTYSVQYYMETKVSQQTYIYTIASVAHCFKKFDVFRR